MRDDLGGYEMVFVEYYVLFKWFLLVILCDGNLKLLLNKVCDKL